MLKGACVLVVVVVYVVFVLFCVSKIYIIDDQSIPSDQSRNDDISM